MTVRRSLFLSNILMIFVPVIAAALTGLFCVGVIWLSVVGGCRDWICMTRRILIVYVLLLLK